MNFRFISCGAKNLKVTLAVVFATILMTGFLSSCATRPPMSLHQKRAIQTKNFTASYNNVFRSIRTIFADEGYVIKEQDFNGGLIVAEAESEKSFSGMDLLFALSSAGSGDVERTSQKYIFSVSLEKYGKGVVRVRTNIRQARYVNGSLDYGGQVLDSKIYNNFYTKVLVELKRRGMGL